MFILEFTAKEAQALKMILKVEISDVEDLIENSIDKADKKELSEYLSLVKTINSKIFHSF